MTSRAPLLAILLSLSLLTGALGCDDDLFAQHLLSRTGYGPDDWSWKRLQTLGVRAYVEEQLHPETIPDPELDAALAQLPTLELLWPELRANYHNDEGALGGPNQPLLELAQAKILRGIMSHRQLEAVMTDLWFNHFNVNGGGGLARWGITQYERDAIRPHVFGRFEDMLLAVAKSPAMLFYLDNYVSTAEGVRVRGRELGLNENWGRELLELHTVGVEAEFALEDVVAVARCFTGWTIDVRGEVGSLDGFVYADVYHDQGPKSILGELEIGPNGGFQDGLVVIAYLARHPLTARRVATKIAARLIDETPDEELIDYLADVYLATDGSLRDVTRAALTTLYFGLSKNYRTKMKRPFHFSISLARATRADPRLILARTRGDLIALGEPLFLAAPPTGYPENSFVWAAGGTLVSRLNTADRVARQAPALGITWPIESGSAEQITDALSAQMIPGGISPDTRAAVVEAVDNLATRREDRKIRAAATLLLQSKDFQLH